MRPDAVNEMFPAVNLMEQSKISEKNKGELNEVWNVLFYTALLFQTLHVLGVFKSLY